MSSPGSMISILAFIVAAIVQTMPAALPVETLNGKALAVPRDATAPSIFVVTFEREASSQASEWTSELRKAISINVYQVAVLESVPGFARSFVAGKIRRSVPRAMHDHFLVASKMSAEWRDAVGFSAANDAYVILATPKGQILWRAHGKFTQARLAEVAAAAQ
jgi:hypothetical protein